MKTDELIKLIAEDTRRPANLSQALALAMIVGSLVAAAMFFLTLGLRPDFDQAIKTLRFPFKFVVTLSLFLSAALLIGRMVRPGQSLTAWRWLLLLGPVLLTSAVIIELAVVPAGLWTTRLIGQNALHCLMTIPALAFFPTVFLFLAMRHGAPDNPGLAGAIAALASAGIAATLYAFNCPDDSPLFMVTWYSIATLIVATAGYFAGRRFLSW
ncbi:NrsF family protein [Rhizobium sp. 9140]|uniref:NrsF family protein n=1 Tax=Rhizobium sp. 9140 TaxID=1761900 RepID=UPI000B85F57D|nr:NrsF family protein [Rhizobium sp. 9140]